MRVSFLILNQKTGRYLPVWPRLMNNWISWSAFFKIHFSRIRINLVYPLVKRHAKKVVSCDKNLFVLNRSTNVLWMEAWQKKRLFYFHNEHLTHRVPNQPQTSYYVIKSHNLWVNVKMTITCLIYIFNWFLGLIDHLICMWNSFVQVNGFEFLEINLWKIFDSTLAHLNGSGHTSSRSFITKSIVFLPSNYSKEKN